MLNAPLGKRLVETSRYPASLAPRARDVFVKPCKGTCGREAERMAVSVVLKVQGGGG